MIETRILAKPSGRASIVATAMKSAVAKEAQRRAGRQAFEGLPTKALTRPELLDRGHPSARRPAAEARVAAGGGTTHACAAGLIRAPRETTWHERC
jgi:hypothetical protein